MTWRSSNEPIHGAMTWIFFEPELHIVRANSGTTTWPLGPFVQQDWPLQEERRSEGPAPNENPTKI